MKTFLIRYFILAVLLLCSVRSFAQQRHTISGTIKDKNNGELIIGAAVQIVQNSAYSAVTNEYGFYSISIPEGQYSIPVALQNQSVISLNCKDTTMQFL